MIERQATFRDMRDQIDKKTVIWNELVTNRLFLNELLVFFYYFTEK